MKPVTIIGGGLAGLALGIALRRRGIPVQLHEAGTYPRHRVCGEFLCGVRPETLERLGIEATLADAEINHSTAWFSGDDPVLKRDLPFPALGISRYRLDARLADLFQSEGGELLTRSRIDPPRDAVGMVRASGRSKATTSDWIGLKGHFRGLDLSADLEMHLGDGGYLGLSRIEDGIVNACGLFRRRRGLDFSGHDSPLPAHAAAGGLGQISERLARATLVDGSTVGVSAFHLGRQRPASGFGNDASHFAIGDHYAIIGPFTGNGMSMALEAADLSIEPLVGWSRGSQTWECAVAAQRSLFARQFRRRLRLSAFLHPFLFSPVGRLAFSGLACGKMLPFTPLFRALR